MKSYKIFLSVLLGTVLTCALAVGLASCGKSRGTTVRYLNFKPEIAEKYEELARIYEKETGVRVIIDTAANNTYEQTLASKMSTSEMPTLFQINGPRGLAAWRDYCADLSGTKLYGALTDKDLALRGGDGGVYGIPYVIEGYGILYNKALTDKYFALTDRKTTFKSMDEINSFEKLSALVTDMQAKKSALGIDGVFAATSLKAGEDWRYTTHLLNIPLYHEFKNGNIDLSGEGTKEISFRYSDGFKNIFDLYVNNSTTDKKLLGTKTVSDSMAEFALGKCVMVQNGNWAWEQIRSVKGNTVREEDIKMLPIYTGIEGEESQGLAIGTENYYCINKKASAEEQRAAADFIYWMYSSEEGKRYVTEEFGFIAPFDTFDEGETPNDPLAKEVLRFTAREDLESVPWNFTVFPSQAFKEGFGSSLLRYVQGSKSFADVVRDTVSSWKTESNLTS